MTRAALAAVLLAVLAGCVTFDQPGTLTVTVLVTHDYGAAPVTRETVQVPNGSTVMDALMEVAQVDAAYGGGFVEAIDGTRSRFPDDRLDWFYEVDGAFAQVGAADWRLEGGERIHWDYRTWDTTDLAPGLFNTFPWDNATILVDGDEPPALPDGWAQRAAPWTNAWPDAPALLITTAERAPWGTVPWFQHDDGTVTWDGGNATGPWTLVTRAPPQGTVRAIMVHHETTGLDLPPRGMAWVYASDGPHEVRP